MPRLKIYNKNINYSVEVRYLGVIIDEKLNFVSHVKYLREKLVNFIMNVRRVAREEWGLKHNIIKILCNAVTLPISTYGATLWFHKVSHIIVRDISTRHKGPCYWF